MILAINTAVSQYCIAIAKEEGVILGECYFGMKKDNFKELVPIFQFMLKSLNLDLKQLSKIFLVLGPGRFTGLRVGISFAKGFSYCLNIPIVGVNSIDALAQNIPSVDSKLYVFVESRRDEWFVGTYTKSQNGKLKRMGEPKVVRRNELRGLFSGKVKVLGHDYEMTAPILKEELGDMVELLPPFYWAFRSSGIIAAGLEALSKEGIQKVEEVLPIYMREPDIRKNNEKKSH